MNDTWDYKSMEIRLQKHLRQYQHTTGHYRQIKRKAILIWVRWMRIVRAGGTP